MNGVLTGTITPGQSEPGSNDNTLHTLRISRTGFSSTEAVWRGRSNPLLGIQLAYF